MSQCVFCKIVAGEIPADEVASSDLGFAFRDLSPAAPTHVLVVPRRHIENAEALQAADAEVLSDLFALANRVAQSEGLVGGYRLVFNVGDDAGNSVAHLHLHLLGGRQLGWPPG